jgi:hypothetical protein
MSPESLCEELRKVPSPEPSIDLLPRILASRAAGVRIVLPTARPGRTRWSIASAAAAVAMAVLGWLAFQMVVPGGWRSESITSDQGASDFLERTPLFLATAYAQEVSDTLGRATYRLLDRVTDTRLTPGSWSYEATMTVDGRITTPQGSRRFTIAPDTYRGEPVWIVATEGKGTYARAPFRDSLIVAQRDLRLLRHSSDLGPGPRVWELSRDSAARFLSWRYADVSWLGSLYRALFQLERLDRDWRGSVYLPWLRGKDGRCTFYALNLHVTGVERVTTPAGTFDAWRVAVQGRRNDMTVWVSTDTRWVVKVAIASGQDAVWEQVLVSATPPAP